MLALEHVLGLALGRERARLRGLWPGGVELGRDAKTRRSHDSSYYVRHALSALPRQRARVIACEGCP